MWPYCMCKLEYERMEIKILLQKLLPLVGVHTDHWIGHGIQKRIIIRGISAQS